MGKRKNRSKRGLGSLPKGLPVRGGGGGGGNNDGMMMNPFEATQKAKRPKFQVHNRNTPATAYKNKPSALAQALERRKTAIQQSMKQAKKANVFSDRRIGEYDHQMTKEEKNLARLVRERTRRSKKVSKYSLQDDDDDDDDDNVLTHRGKAIDSLTAADHVILSDEDEDGIGNLDATDTLMHFGGGGANKRKNAEAEMYGGVSASNIAGQYGDSARKLELDDLIARRKTMKAEKMKSKEDQVTKFEQMDESFAELANLLEFRDKEKEIRSHIERKREKNLSPEEQEFEDWDKEMKEYLYTSRKVAATDRTKTPEEIAKEEAERLHKLETRRLARMNGDFDGDDFDDVDTDSSDDESDTGGKNKKKSKYTKRKKLPADHVEALDNDSDQDESDDELKIRFTADGLVQVDKDGKIVGKVGEKKDEGKNVQHDTSNLKVGTRVSACYRAKEQFDENESWFNGVIAQVNKTKDGVTYNVDYDDGDFEDDVEPRHIRVIEKTGDELEKESANKAEELVLKKKRQKAKEKARSEIPFVFEVPTTLDALHDMISNYATTGEDVSLIIQRIHKANSVRLDRRNVEKMQNFYDVLIRRFIAVGDAIHNSGDGGMELSRYKQLDALTLTMYEMAQESPECAASVWSRRLGFFHNAHAKRMRDAEFERDDEEEDFTAWPSTGVVLALRLIGHIFPVTDKRHHIVTPTILFLGQMLSTTPILSMHDLVLGMMCCGVLIEYTKEAKRVAPEAHAFLASILRLFAFNREERLNRSRYPIPTLGAAACEDCFSMIRSEVTKYKGETEDSVPQLSLEREAVSMKGEAAASILHSALHFVEVTVQNLDGALSSAEKEAFAQITESVLCLKPRNKSLPLPALLQIKVASVASALQDVCKFDEARLPLQRRSGPSIRQAAIKSLAPRLENPDKYSLSKDKGKKAEQAAADRARREYKREHKAVARELRLDGTFVEKERRTEQEKRDNAARARRQRAFAWLEGEQAAMNQQVRQGGGLLQGGGTGAARAKARSGKMGIKKGGKF